MNAQATMPVGGPFGPYGAVELKQVYNRNLGIALAVSVGFFAGLLFFYIFLNTVGNADEEKNYIPVNVTSTIDLSTSAPEDLDAPPPPPPPMIPPELQGGGGGGGVAARAGVPIAVPDALITPDVAKFATTEEISVAQVEAGDGTGFLGDGSEGLGTPMPIDVQKPVEVKKEEEIPPPDKFIPVEEQPQFDYGDLMRRAPYPEMARRNGIEGQVVVKVWVDKTGRPSRPFVEYSDNKVFNSTSIDAVMNTRFTPAIQNKTPVGVWLAITLRYKLNE